MPKTVFLVDGMYLLFSSFYSNRNMRTLSGDPTGAVFGFVNRIESLLKELDPQQVAVAFDHKEKTFRHLMYEPYKAKRLAAPEELIGQIPLVREYLALRGISLFEEPGFEADDIIASIARREGDKGNEVVIFTADKDLFQLVRDKIYIYHPKQKQKLDAAGITEHFGVAPDQVVDYLSLVGDSSDNIPGLPGVGEKTAKKIIDQYGTIENILANLDQVDEKLKKKITDNLDLLKMSMELIDLDRAPQLDKELSLTSFSDQVTTELLEYFRKLSFNTLVRRFEGKAGLPPPPPAEKLNIQYHIVRTPDQLLQLAHRIKQEGYFAFDLETTALEFYQSRIVGLSISFKDGGYYIPFLCSEAEKKEISFDFAQFKQELGPLFADPEIKKIGHNLKFDILHLKHNGIETRGIQHDTMIMSYLIQANRRAHNLKDLTQEVLKYRQTEFKELTGKGTDQKQLITVDLETISRYCIDDSYLTLELVEILGKSINDKQLTTLYETIEMPLIEILMEMEYTGVQVDSTFLKRAAVSLSEKIAVIENEIFELAGQTFNLNSSQQLGELLFEKMNLPMKKRTRKTKSYSTDIDVLNELRAFPIVEKIIDYRTLKKLLSTYLEGLMDCVDQDRRIHGSFNQTVTATGRLSSSNPNLQNIPVGETGGVTVREAFVAAEGKQLLAADYSQVELRVMAYFSQDPNLVDAFAGDFDIHKHTADTVFAADLFSSPQEKRKRAKIINFSVLYGTGPYSLSKELGVSYKEAKEFIDTYFEKNSGVKRFMDKIIADAEVDVQVKTISGRIREIPEIISSNRTVKENGNRMAVNTVIQGSAADIIKIAMINIHRQLSELKMKSRLIMQVHDELIFEYPPDEEIRLSDLVRREMENALPLNRVPLKVDIKKGANWGRMS